MCGEKPDRGSTDRRGRGSPPRVRGKGGKRRQIVEDFRITPACAGKSTASSTAAFVPRDHPRVCGEKFRENESIRKHIGSPPRVRGKVRADLHAVFTVRITPACAGKSRLHPDEHLLGEDHPRVCGEKEYPEETVSIRIGSPPRVRGKD